MALTRRDFFKRGTFGLAAAGAGGLILRAGATATAASGDLGDYGRYLAVVEHADADPPPPTGDRWAATQENILGPFYRDGAPYRGKITPPLAKGSVLVIRGRVWGLDTRQPLKHAVLDIWQADVNGRYDNDDPRNPPAPDVFAYRARLIADEQGYYEYETIHPGRYKIGANTWRPSHIHYLVRHPNYKTLVTQLYFKGDPMNETDRFIRESLIIDPETVKVEDGEYRLGTFDIVLPREQ